MKKSLKIVLIGCILWSLAVLSACYIKDSLEADASTVTEGFSSSALSDTDSWSGGPETPSDQESEPETDAETAEVTEPETEEATEEPSSDTTAAADTTTNASTITEPAAIAVTTAVTTTAVSEPSSTWFWERFTRREAETTTTAPAVPPQNEEALLLLRQRVSEICKKYNVTGFSMTVFKNQSELTTLVYGYADVPKKLPVTGETKFRIASMSKFMTGILAMRLVEAGQLDLDRDISEYVGVKIRSPYYPNVPITTRMLMNHSSSIVDGDGAFCDGRTMKQVFATGGTYFSRNKPGAVYIYSNFGASLISAIMEAASGTHFADYSKSVLHDLMGLDAAYYIDQLSDRNLVADMYRGGALMKSQKTRSSASGGCYNTPLGQYFNISFGNLMISSRDMAKITMAMANGGTYHGKKLLEPGSVAMMNKKVEGSGSPWGLMRKIVKDNLISGRTLIGHNGQAYGLIAATYFDPTDKTGFVYMTNGSNEVQGRHTFAITEAVAKAAYEYLGAF